MMKNVNLVGAVFIGLIIGGAGGFIWTMSSVSESLEFHVHQPIRQFSDIVDDAYINENRAVAIWAVETLIEMLQTAENEDYENRWMTQRDISYLLMVQHVRLSELSRGEDSEDSKFHMDEALKRAVVIFDDEIDESRLRSLLADRGLLARNP